MMQLKNKGKIGMFLLYALSITLHAQVALIKPVDSDALSNMKWKVNFIIASDLGRNGYYDQKPVAEMMGEVAGLIRPKFIAALGDVHHFMGVESVNDPLWMTNYELIYSHPELMIPWYPILGNHEYQGNTQAVLDYSTISRRWQMPSDYYSKEIALSDSIKALLVFINTTTLIEYYWNKKEYSDASKDKMEQQLNWVDSVLKTSNAKWKIVMGHHPIYANTRKSEKEQQDMQNNLLPILEKHNTDLYVCGHIHNFQHIKIANSQIDYLVNTSASLARKVEDIDGTIFKSPDSGFSICTLEEDKITISLVNKQGEIIYQFVRR